MTLWNMIVFCMTITPRHVKPRIPQWINMHCWLHNLYLSCPRNAVSFRSKRKIVQASKGNRSSLKTTKKVPFSVKITKVLQNKLLCCVTFLALHTTCFRNAKILDQRFIASYLSNRVVVPRNDCKNLKENNIFTKYFHKLTQRRTFSSKTGKCVVYLIERLMEE